MITLSTRFYGLRMNLRSATRDRNHETRRSEAEPLWLTEQYLPCVRITFGEFDSRNGIALGSAVHFGVQPGSGTPVVSRNGCVARSERDQYRDDAIRSYELEVPSAYPHIF